MGCHRDYCKGPYRTMIGICSPEPGREREDKTKQESFQKVPKGFGFRASGPRGLESGWARESQIRVLDTHASFCRVPCSTLVLCCSPEPCSKNDGPYVIHIPFILFTFILPLEPPKRLGVVASRLSGFSLVGFGIFRGFRV